MSWTHTEPSPTAEATRLTLPDRTSPTAKTPGRLVSSSSGRRVRGQRGLLELLGLEVGSGLDEALVVERHASLEPGGVRVGAGHQEHVADRARLRFPGVEVAPSDLLEAVGPLEQRRSACACAASTFALSSMRWMR